jgi:HEAT repeat protein
MKRSLVVACLVLLSFGCGGRSAQDWVAQLHDKDPVERLRAVRALGANHSETAVVVPALAGALKDEDASVRRAVAQTLGQIGGDAKEAAPNLVAALKDRSGGVKRAAAAALKRVDPQVATQAGIK